MTFEEFKSRFEHKKVSEFSNRVQSKPLVSICVQTYQHEPYIAECLDGLLMQKVDFQYEIIISEDNSSDRTREICKQYAEKYPDKIRLFLHHRENNISIKGRPTGRFVALFNLFSSNGKYIAFCEGDDFWNTPEKLQRQMNFMKENPTYSMCFHKRDKWFEKEGILHKADEGKVRHLEKNQAGKISIPTATAFMKNVFNDIPEEIIDVPHGDIFIFTYMFNFGNAADLGFVGSCYRITGKGAYSGIKLIERFKNVILTRKIMLSSSAFDESIKDQIRQDLKRRKKEYLKKLLLKLEISGFFRILFTKF